MRSWGVTVFSLLLAMLTAVATSQTASPTPITELSSAQSLIQAGKFREASENFRRIIAQHPAPEAYAGLIRSLLKLDDVAAAEQASAAGLRDFPQSAVTQAARGDVRFRSGFITEAQTLYQSALRLDATNARAWLGLGRVDSVLSRYAKSKEDFARAHELDPADGDSLYYWSIGQPYPENVKGLEKHLAAFHDDAERERHEREYISFIKAIAGRRVWVQAHEVTRSEIKLQPVITRLQDGPRAFALPVRLNDRVNASAMLDTGAAGLTISRKLAEKSGAKKLVDHSLEGVGSAGASMGYEAWLDKVTIGDFEFHDCNVHVSPSMSADYDGLIGSDLFEQYLVTIDFPAHKLRLDPPRRSAQNAARSLNADATNASSSTANPPAANPTPSNSSNANAMHANAMDADATASNAEAVNFANPNLINENAPDDPGDPIQVYRVGHILLLPTSVGDTAHGLFALDSGASTNAISPSLARQVSTVRDSNVPVNGVSGRVQNVYSADQTTLQFGRFRQPHENMVTFDVPGVSKDLGVEVSGFIGFATLKKMKVLIDYQTGRVDFEYKP